MSECSPLLRLLGPLRISGSRDSAWGCYIGVFADFFYVFDRISIGTPTSLVVRFGNTKWLTIIQNSC